MMDLNLEVETCQCELGEACWKECQRLGLKHTGLFPVWNRDCDLYPNMVDDDSFHVLHSL